MVNETVEKLLDAALIHVPFDGWSSGCFQAAIIDSGINAGLAQALCPRGAVDLAVAFHKRGDKIMQEGLTMADLSDMRFRDKVTHAVHLRLLACEDKEIIRRGSSLFALPKYAPLGAELIWGTADAIWTALGDTSEDINWYTKRATLSGVYGSTVLFWLGDDSADNADTWEFLDRRIENVMQFEKFKAQFNQSPIGKALSGPLEALSRMRKPNAMPDMPGRWG